MKAEKGEGFRPPLAALLSSQGRQPAELDQPRLVVMERQAKLGQPVLEVSQHPSRICRHGAAKAGTSRGVVVIDTEASAGISVRVAEELG